MGKFCKRKFGDWDLVRPQSCTRASLHPLMDDILFTKGYHPISLTIHTDPTGNSDYADNLKNTQQRGPDIFYNKHKNMGLRKPKK